MTSHPTLPKITIWTMIRLGLFQTGLGIMSVLLFGLLNRILIKELNVPGTIASLILAVTLFVAPFRIWFGQLSDTRPWFGLHRTPYVIGGAFSFATIAFLAVQPLWQLEASLRTSGWAGASLWVLLSAALFALYGIAIGASSTPFATLLVDITDEEDRSRIVAIDWAMLLMGTISGGITIGVLLKKMGNNPSPELLQASINNIFLVVPWIVVGLAIFATWGIEQKYSRFLARPSAEESRSESARFEDPEAEPKIPGKPEAIGLDRAWRILTSNRQTRFFFTFLLAMTLGLFLQDTILEPYGGDIFKLTPGETALLNVPYGMGTVAGILIAGFGIAPRLGKKRTLQLGCQAVIVTLAAIVFAGFSGNPNTLKVCLALFGLASGVTTTGAITLMLDLTAAETAGTFIGAWGLAQAMARGMATIFGGSLLDVGTKLAGVGAEGRSMVAYGVVFLAQAGCMGLALGLLTRVNVLEFQNTAKENLAAVIQND